MLTSNSSICTRKGQASLICRFGLFGAIGGAFLGSLFVSEAFAQRGRRGQEEEIELLTKDGVQLGATYFRSQEREAIPIVFLHDHKDTRAKFAGLARTLVNLSANDEEEAEQQGTGLPPFAALTVDLRGHGESTQQRFPNGIRMELDASRLKPDGFRAMANFDMEAVRKFLVTKNDDRELNLNELVLVGVGMGANVAAAWAAEDWNAPPLAIGKQGQDVKGLVLVTPRWKQHGLLMQQALKSPGLRRHAAFCLVCGGEDSRVLGDVNRIYKLLSRYHEDSERESADKVSSLMIMEVPTSLQGSELFAKMGRREHDAMIRFILQEVASKEHPWLNRRDRL